MPPPIPKHFGVAYSRRLVRPSVSSSVRTSHSCPAHNFVFCNRISKLFHRNDHHVETTCRAQHLGPFLEGQGHSATLQENRFRPITLLFEVDFESISQKWSPYWADVLRATFGLLPWRSRSQHDHAAKSFPANNFVIWSRFKNYFTWIITILKRRVECNIKAAILKVKVTARPKRHNRVRSITLLFEVGFYHFL